MQKHVKTEDGTKKISATWLSVFSPEPMDICLHNEVKDTAWRKRRWIGRCFNLCVGTITTKLWRPS